jgi:hypothetical protein
MWLRDVILGRAKNTDSQVATPELQDQARTVVEWLSNCDRQPVPLASLVLVVQAVLADLGAGDLDEIWYSIASRGCGRHFSEQDRQWVAFLQAVGQRDGNRMAAASKQLLAAEPGLSDSSKRYLVAGGMLGSISQAQLAEAHALWSEHADTLRSKDDLLMSLLVARSGGAAN